MLKMIGGNILTSEKIIGKRTGRNPDSPYSSLIHTLPNMIEMKI